MKAQRFNWPIWGALLLSLIAFLSYPVLLVRFPVTRDFPWVNLVLFAFVAILLFSGIRRAFAPDRPRPRWSRIAGVVVAALTIAVFGLFIFSAFIGARYLPASQNAPHVGQKAPDFMLTDTKGNSVSLSELISSPTNGKAPKGVLLIFYRGYW